jgi:hypothetical protein
VDRCYVWRYYGSGGGFWLLGMLTGFALYLALPHLVVIGKGLLTVALLLAVPLLLLFAWWAVRRTLRARERRRRRREAPPAVYYADGAYIV